MATSAGMLVGLTFSRKHLSRCGHTCKASATLQAGALRSGLVSRSQFTWVMNRATQFKTVILDVEGVVHVGQAFVDKVFRVFATALPHIRLKTIDMISEVAKL